MDQLTISGGTITLIHFVCNLEAPPPSGDGPPVLQLRIACMPNMTEFGTTLYHPNYQRSDDPRAVTCPACKRSPVFKKAQEVLDSAIARTRAR